MPVVQSLIRITHHRDAGKTVILISVSPIKKFTQRKGAKNAKCFIIFVKEFLCVFAVKTVFMDED
jgi:hypothetical protein